MTCCPTLRYFTSRVEWETNAATHQQKQQRWRRKQVNMKKTAFKILYKKENESKAFVRTPGETECKCKFSLITRKLHSRYLDCFLVHIKAAPLKHFIDQPAMLANNQIPLYKNLIKKTQNLNSIIGFVVHLWSPDLCFLLTSSSVFSCYCDFHF